MSSTACIRELDAHPEHHHGRSKCPRAVRPDNAAELLLSSGRRVCVRAGRGGDEIVVHAPSGATVVRIELTAAGATVDLSGAPLELRAGSAVTLVAEQLELRASRDLTLSAGRRLTLDGADLELGARSSMRLRSEGNWGAEVAGWHHLRVGGAERVEAASVELQANEASARVRAMGAIELDAEHIGLNDDPCPGPFPWSAIGQGARGHQSTREAEAGPRSGEGGPDSRVGSPRGDE